MEDGGKGPGISSIYLSFSMVTAFHVLTCFQRMCHATVTRYRHSMHVFENFDLRISPKSLSHVFSSRVRACLFICLILSDMSPEHARWGCLLLGISWRLFLSIGRNYRPSIRENKLKTIVLYDWKRAFWACFRENWVYKFGHMPLNYFSAQVSKARFLRCL